MDSGDLAKDAKLFCLETARTNYGSFVNKKEGAQILGLDLFQVKSLKRCMVVFTFAQDTMQALTSATENSFKTTHDSNNPPANTLVNDYKYVAGWAHLYSFSLLTKGTLPANCDRPGW